MARSALTITFPGGAQLRPESFASRAHEKPQWRSGVNVWNHYVATEPLVYDALSTRYAQWPALFRDARCVGDLAATTEISQRDIPVSRMAIDATCSAIGTGSLLITPVGGFIMGGFLGLQALLRKMSFWKNIPHVVQRLANPAATCAALGVAGYVVPDAYTYWTALGFALWAGESSVRSAVQERLIERERPPQRASAIVAATEYIAHGPDTVRALVRTHPEIVEHALSVWLPEELRAAQHAAERVALVFESATAEVVLRVVSEEDRRRLLDVSRIFLPQVRRAIEGVSLLASQRSSLPPADRLERTIALTDKL